MEDQVGTKRCGHRPGKEVVSTAEMVDRIHAAVDARTDPAFVLMARTDALANEPIEAVLDRVSAYVEAGADMIFAEAVTDLPTTANSASAPASPSSPTSPSSAKPRSTPAINSPPPASTSSSTAAEPIAP